MTPPNLVSRVHDYFRANTELKGIRAMAELGDELVAVHDGCGEWDVYFLARQWELSNRSAYKDSPGSVFVTGKPDMGVLSGVGCGASGFEACVAMASRNLTPRNGARFYEQLKPVTL